MAEGGSRAADRGAMENFGLISEPLEDGVWMVMRRRRGGKSHAEMEVSLVLLVVMGSSLVTVPTLTGIIVRSEILIAYPSNGVDELLSEHYHHHPACFSSKRTILHSSSGMKPAPFLA
jgi:hypothetical protein